MNKKTLNIILNGSIRSYSQVFFSDNIIFAVILFIVSFFDIYAGIAGVISILTTNTSSVLLGFSELHTKKGIYGFNSLLVGLGIGLMFSMSPQTITIIVIASIITLIFTITLEGFFAKYYLPFLSIPFLLVMWLILLASRDFTAIGISERGIYTVNELYQLGGKNLIDIYQWFDSIEKPLFIKTYFLSLGAIFFQYNILAGIFISAGLLYHSRIAFLLSILGFSIAFLFYQFLGADITQYGYTYIGFNYILTAIAIGGHFLIPNRYSFLWVVLLLPIVVLFTLGFSRLLAPFQLPVYSLPFNIIVILFLYFIKLRLVKNKHLTEVITQLNSPEMNLYFAEQAEKRFKWLSFFPISLPFLGQWKVSQAEDGDYTHQGEWKHAWDFIIVDDQEKQYTDAGDFPKDYYCYDKSITAPADGIVVDIIDGVEDNVIGDVNLMQNWGNSIVIKHTEYLYSQLSHIKKGSFKVKKDDFVRRGDVLARCGNSGRSPYPHLHFQIQATPYIGSKTIDYPINHYIKKDKAKFELHSYDKPGLNDLISNVKINSLLKNALNLIPGQKLSYSLNGEIENWEIKTDYYNNTYIYCKEKNTYAYLYNDGFVHYFKSFSGDKNSALYYFYLALYHVPLGYYQNLEIEDRFPPNVATNKYKMILHDFLAPFYPIYKLFYKMKFLQIDNELSPEELTLSSNILKYFISNEVDNIQFKVLINIKGVSEIKSNNIHVQLIK